MCPSFILSPLHQVHSAKLIAIHTQLLAETILRRQEHFSLNKINLSGRDLVLEEPKTRQRWQQHHLHSVLFQGELPVARPAGWITQLKTLIRTSQGLEPHHIHQQAAVTKQVCVPCVETLFINAAGWGGLNCTGPPGEPSRATTHSWKGLFACFTTPAFKRVINSARKTLNTFYFWAAVLLTHYSAVQAVPRRIPK